MSKATSNFWSYTKLFFQLEVKKWTHFYATNSYLPLFYFVFFSLLSLTFLNLNLYKPLWQANPRGIVIGGLIFIFVGFLILSIFNAIYPADETGVLLPVNPFYFTQADLSVIVLSSGRPLSYALIGWFRTSVKSVWYSMLFFGISFTYCIEFFIPLIHVVFILGIFFLSFQGISLSCSLIYALIEEIIEQKRPRWRETNYRSLNLIGVILTIIVIFGGLGFLRQLSEDDFLQLDLLVQDLYFIPPFNIIYIIMVLLSKSWPQSNIIPAFMILVLLFLIINLFFFLIIGSIDPLARLYERRELVSNLSTLRVTSPNLLKRFSPIITGFISPNHKIQEAYTLVRKDLLLCWKYRQLLSYIAVLFLIYGSMIVSLLIDNRVNLLIFLVGFLWSYWITFFLWQKESKSISKTFNISKFALIVEKWSLSFILTMFITIPLLLLQESIFFLSGLILYYVIFLLGFIHFSLKKSD